MGLPLLSEPHNATVYEELVLHDAWPALWRWTVMSSNGNILSVSRDPSPWGAKQKAHSAARSRGHHFVYHVRPKP